MNTPTIESRPLSLQQLLAMLAARRGLIASVTAAIFLLTLVLSLLLPKVWTASSDIYIDYRENDPIGGQKLSAMLDDSYMQTQLDLLHSQRVAEGVIEDLGLRETAAYREAVKASGQAQAEQNLIETILKNANIQRTRGSRVVTVEFNARTPQQARDYTNAIINSYIHLGEQIASTAARSRFEQYNAQLGQLRNEVDTIQNRLTEYQQKNDILNVQDHGDQETQKLNELNKSLFALQNTLQEAQANQQAMHDFMNSGFKVEELPAVNQTSVINMLKSQLGYVDRQLGDVQGALGPQHPTVRGLHAERRKLLDRIARESEAILAGMQSNIIRLETQVAELEAEVAQQRKKVLAQMELRNQIAAYQRQLASAQQVYSTALTKYDGLIMASNIQSPNVDVLRPAELPTVPSKPKLKLNLAAGLVAGLFIALFMALLLELLRRRVHIAEDLQNDAELPLLGQIGPQDTAQ